jgi:hypothetical protein
MGGDRIYRPTELPAVVVSIPLPPFFISIIFIIIKTTVNMKNDFMTPEQIERARKVLEEMERLSELMKIESNEVINETSLSKIWRYTEEYDVAMISAFRKKNINCLSIIDGEEGHEFTRKENLERNKDLYSALLELGYGITKVRGNYIENFGKSNSYEVSEQTFFVVNRKNDSDFFDNIIKLGKYFCQDSVFIKPKDEDAYLYGTNNSDFPGLDNQSELGKYHGGQTGEFMTRVGKTNRPLVFKEHQNVSGMYLISQRARTVLKYI